MARGRRHDRPELSLIKGNAGPKGASPPSIPCEVAPDCPFPLDEFSGAEWFRLAPMLQRSGRLGPGELSTFWLYCDAYSRYRRASDELRSATLAMKTDLGGLKAHPASATVKEAGTTMIKLLGLFGLTPADRSRVDIEDPGDADDADRRMFGG